MQDSKKVRALLRKEKIARLCPVKKGDRIRKYYYEGVVEAVTKPHATRLKVRIDKVDTRDQNLIGTLWVCWNDERLFVLKGDDDGASARG